MAAKKSVLGLILPSYPYLRSAMVRFPLKITLVGHIIQILKCSNIFAIPARSRSASPHTEFPHIPVLLCAFLPQTSPTPSLLWA